MRQTKRLLSVVCALAMIFSMFSAFTIAKAADNVAILVDVLEDTTTTKDNGTIKLQYRIKGLTSVNSVTIKLPTDPAVYTCTKADIVAGDVLKNITAATTNVTKAGKVNFVWTSADPATIDENTVLATITLTAPTKVTAKQELAIEKDSIEIISAGTTYDGTAVTANSVTVSKPQLSQKILVDVTENGTKTGEKVVLQYRLKGITSVNSVTLKLPVDLTKFSCTKADIVAGDVLKTITAATTNVTKAGKVNFVWTSAEPATIDENTVLATITLTLLQDLTADEVLNIEEDSIEIISDGTTYGKDNIDVPAITVSKDGATGGDDKPPVTDEEYAVTVSVSPKKGGTAAADVEKAKAGTKVTVTYEAADGYELDKITVNGDAIDAADGKAEFTMPSEEAKVVVKFAEKAEEETAKEYILKATKGDKGDLGQVYDITVTGNADYVGTAHDKFDIVVTMFDDDNVAIGYMIYNDVTVDSDISVCVHETKGSIAVNLVDDFTADNMGTVLAKRVTAK